MTAPTPKAPPHSMEAEQSVLGGLMLNNAAWYDLGILSTEDFYGFDHQLIYRAIGELIGKNKPADFVTLSEHLRQLGKLEDVGGLTYLGMLAADTPSAGNVAAYAEIVRQRATQRAVIAAGAIIAGIGYQPADRDIPGLIAAAGEAIEHLSRRTSGGSQSFADAVSSTFASLDAARAKYKTGDAVGATFGLPSLDHVLGELTGPRLVVVAARPATGKTALLNAFAVRSAGRGLPGVIFSLEMGSEELVARAVAAEAGLNVSRLMRAHNTEVETGRHAARHLESLPLYLDTQTIDLGAIVASVLAHKRRYGIRWAAVDHIGLVRTGEKFATTNDRISAITTALKRATKACDIPIIALAQLNRSSEREARRPRLDDLRDSGSIEQDADMVIALHCPPDKRSEPLRPIEVGVLKNRAGPSCWLDATIKFDGVTQRFREITDRYPAPPSRRRTQTIIERSI